jgi:hypothetical protein
LPLESLIISYPYEGLKDILDDLPSVKYSNDLEESFTESSKSISDSESSATSSLKSTIPTSLIEDQEAEQKKENISKGGSSSSLSSSSLSSKYKQVQIDPHELTGRKGLERVMNYTAQLSPPEKGSFEYKKPIENKYGKIFSKNIIGKYSLKIKNILESIYSSETDKVSEGVILIYSQYIDSGLIPVALALEEMGFTRYGQNAKPLFKNKPSELVDVRTMKVPEDKKNFIPARYSMITGDPRLSPNNDYEVKGLTNEDNKTGNKVKVVLISKAGSEGIDLKFIRQIHVLEPWYNLNRIEQIIGRGVRNFSHKDLPFEKRNTQIFLYGTILNENVEEAADLYVYRVAEMKAKQMGKVSRVLKETAVDCIINHEQTNFTQHNLNEKINGTITQELSTGIIDKNFKIGDAPYSAACDYMEVCEYNCVPNKIIDEEDLNEDTYHEKFIMINSEKILQKIRLLMKQSFFYKKDVLIDLINVQKKYPYVQIYAALTQLIEDNNEFIVDKYGRTGHLINIGEYYLFQPSELRNKNTSIFERSVPIDFKHSMVNFELNQDILNPNIDKRNINVKNGDILDEDDVEDESINNGKKLFEEMKVNYDLAIDYTKVDPVTNKYKKVQRADDNWFKHCGIVIRKMSIDYPELPQLEIVAVFQHI